MVSLACNKVKLHTHACIMHQMRRMQSACTPACIATHCKFQHLCSAQSHVGGILAPSLLQSRPQADSLTEILFLDTACALWLLIGHDLAMREQTALTSSVSADYCNVAGSVQCLDRQEHATSFAWYCLQDSGTHASMTINDCV